MTCALAVLLASDDPGWLLAAEGSIERAGHIAVGDCPDVVSLMARATLDIADLVLVDSRSVDLDVVAVTRLRRSGLIVAEVGDAVRAEPAGARFAGFDEALTWSVREFERPDAIPGRSSPLVAVFGCKGAPGATSMAIDIARQTARRMSVSLIDLDARGGDIGTYLRLPQHPNVLSAVEAIGQGRPWHFTRTRSSLSVLVAPVRPGWTSEVVPADLAVLLDHLGPCVVDVGSVEAEADELARLVVARASCVVLVGGDGPVNRVHLDRARLVLEQIAPTTRVVAKNHHEVAVELVLSDAEQKRQPG